MVEGTPKDFFISYNKADRPWAEWIAWQLESEGHTTILQAWDFLPGSNFILMMQQAASSAARTIALLSAAYLDALYTQPEWAAAFAQDPTGQKGTLLPVRVHECTLTGLLAPIVYVDLVNLAEGAAREALLAGIRRTRARPSQAPGFPGSAQPSTAVRRQTPDFPGDWPIVWNVPYRRNPFFTGREALLTLLHDSLVRSQATALTQARAISGLGGIGKTQTALEYAYRYGHLYHYVLWVGAATPEALLTGFVKLATLLDVPGQDEQDQQKTVEAVKAWLSGERDWLLILDNADDLELAANYFPEGAGSNGHILLTTRAQNAGALAELVDVEKMDSDEGTLLLLRRARLLAQQATLEQATPKDRAGAQAIVAAMDGLPLALDQVGAYLQETASSLSDYLKLYERRRKDLLARRGHLPPGHPETVATTWSLSFQQVEQASPASAELLRLCAFLAPDSIPEELFSAGATELGKVLGPVAADEYLLNEAIEVLRRYSLVRRNASTKLLSIHRLVQTVLVDAMKEKAQRLWAERAVRAVNAVFPNVDYETWAEAERYLSQVPVCVALLDRYGLAFVEAAELLYETGYYWYQHAGYLRAEPLYQQALRISEQVLGPEHSSTANALDLLARLYRDQGKYGQAEPLFQRTLAISEQVQGPEHPSTATTLHELGRLYLNQGKYEEAEPLYQRALRISEQVLGPEHPSTATTLQVLGSLYLEQDKYEEAEPLLRRALRINEQVRPEHPETANTLHELGRLYFNQGKYQEAEPLYQRALHISEQVQGPEHPSAAVTLSALASLYLEQGKNEEAEPLLQRALRINEQVRPEHPETASTLNELGRLYLEEGKSEQAEVFFQRALRIKEQVLGPEHPSTAITVGNYAYLLRRMKREREAALLEARFGAKEKKPGASS